MNPESYFEAGHDDLAAWTGDGNSVTSRGSNQPTQDSLGAGGRHGSAHPSGFHMSFCDGSVRVVTYDVDLYVHVAGMHRVDGSVPGQTWDPRATRSRN
jgi:prepilin-type processing-associated H-X9-DG protein